MTRKTIRETDVMHRIVGELSHGNTRLFRNNIGNAWMGSVSRLKDGSVLIRKPRRVGFGLGGEGGSDLIGFRSVLVTPEMVGQTIAVFAAVEVKSATGTPTAEQRNFINMVIDHGGRAGIARSPEEAEEILE